MRERRSDRRNRAAVLDAQEPAADAFLTFDPGSLDEMAQDVEGVFDG